MTEALYHSLDTDMIAETFDTFVTREENPERNWETFVSVFASC